MKTTIINHETKSSLSFGTLNSLRGRGQPAHIFVDEAAFFESQLFPNLINDKTKLFLTSTTNGKNWFYDIFNNSDFITYYPNYKNCWTQSDINNGLLIYSKNNSRATKDTPFYTDEKLNFL